MIWAPIARWPSSRPSSLSSNSRPVGELAGLADVVEERRRHQQVGVEPRMELAELADQRPHGDRVLEQAAEVGVVAGAGAWGAAEVGGDRAARAGAARHRPQQGRVVDLARQVLEEALELLDRAIGGGQELRRVERPGLQALARRRARRPARRESARARPRTRDRVAALEAQADAVGLAEHPGGQRAGAVAQLERRYEPPFARSAGPSAGTRSDPRTAGPGAGPRPAGNAGFRSSERLRLPCFDGDRARRTAQPARRSRMSE